MQLCSQFIIKHKHLRNISVNQIITQKRHKAVMVALWLIFICRDLLKVKISHILSHLGRIRDLLLIIPLQILSMMKYRLQWVLIFNKRAIAIIIRLLAIVNCKLSSQHNRFQVVQVTIKWFQSAHFYLQIQLRKCSQRHHKMQIWITSNLRVVVTTSISIHNQISTLVSSQINYLTQNNLK